MSIRLTVIAFLGLDFAGKRRNFDSVPAASVFAAAILAQFDPIVFFEQHLNSQGDPVKRRVVLLQLWGRESAHAAMTVSESVNHGLRAI
jgi:hypothetical protein